MGQNVGNSTKYFFKFWNSSEMKSSTLPKILLSLFSVILLKSLCCVGILLRNFFKSLIFSSLQKKKKNVPFFCNKSWSLRALQIILFPTLSWQLKNIVPTWWEQAWVARRRDKRENFIVCMFYLSNCETSECIYYLSKKLIKFKMAWWWQLRGLFFILLLFLLWFWWESVGCFTLLCLFLWQP